MTSVSSRRERFGASNAFLVVVSPTAPGELEALREPLVRARTENPFEPEVGELTGSGNNRLITRRQLGPHSLVGVTHVYQPRERYPLAAVAMLNNLVGGGPHSKLFKELRVETQMGYDVGASVNALSRYVMTEGHAIVRKRDNLTALERILEAYRWLGADALDAESFEKARLSMHRQIDQIEDSPTELCMWLAHEVWSTPEPSPRSYQQQLRDLTLDDARTIARDVFSPDHRVTVIAGSCGFFKKRRAAQMLGNTSRS